MPHFPVLQPDGKLAVWSTIVDHFTALCCTPEEAVAKMALWHTGPLAELTQRVANGELPFDHWRDWPDCAAEALYRHGGTDETVREVLAMTDDPMTLRYIEMSVATWKAEASADDLRYELAAANARISALEAQLAAVPAENIGHILELAWSVLAAIPAGMNSMPGRVVCASVQKWLAERQQPEGQP